MLLHGDPRIPADDFIASSDVDAIAADALERLNSLGYVGVIEEGDDVWRGLSALFGTQLEPERENVSGEEAGRPEGRPMAAWDAQRTLELLDRLTRIDAVLYRHAVAADDAEAFAEAAFARQLVRVGDVFGREGRLEEIERLRGELADRDATIKGLHREVAKRDADIEWLHREVAARESEKPAMHPRATP
jgi:hypothetical protein